MHAIYAIAWSSRGPTKIGIATSPVKRLNQLQTSHPYRLRIYFAALVEDRGTALTIEGRVLADARRDRLLGEWLKSAPQQAADAIRLACDQLELQWIKWRPNETELGARELRMHKIKMLGRRQTNRSDRTETAISEHQWLTKH